MDRSQLDVNLKSRPVEQIVNSNSSGNSSSICSDS